VFSAREIRAEEALSLGLALAVVPAEGLREAALQYAQSFDHAPTQALGLAKSMLNRSFETDRHTLWQMEAAAQALCASSSYSADAVRRFRVKEAPRFSGAPALTGKP
jgi:2-(1,2-epoxy-1,2-dihydrophenyl)acetyl-CoA isomerase